MKWIMAIAAVAAIWYASIMRQVVVQQWEYIAKLETVVVEQKNCGVYYKGLRL